MTLIIFMSFRGDFWSVWSKCLHHLPPPHPHPVTTLVSHQPTHFSLCEPALRALGSAGAGLALIHIISRSSLFNHC